MSKLREYKKIALFVHVQPDFDAYSSSFGLRKWIKDNFPEITVYLMIPKEIINPEEKFLFDLSDDLPKQVELSDALGIVLDTPNTNRILTQMHVHCKELIVIDHHPKEITFGQLEYIDPTFPAVSHMLAEIFLYLEKNGNFIFSEEIAQYFYAGIITDTNNFMSLSMIPSTYEIISKLVSKGINRKAIHSFIFVRPFGRKLFDSAVTNRTFLTSNSLAYAVVPEFLFKKYEINNVNIVNNLENIDGVEVWSTLVYDSVHAQWKCSIRSKDLMINNIAKLYGGGGHKTMAAVLFPKKFNYYQMIATMDEYLSDHGFKNSTSKQKRFNFVLSFIKAFNLFKRL